MCVCEPGGEGFCALSFMGIVVGMPYAAVSVRCLFVRISTADFEYRPWTVSQPMPAMGCGQPVTAVTLTVNRGRVL